MKTRTITITLLCAAAGLLPAASATASSTQELVLQDDPHTVHARNDRALEGTIWALKLLGVDRLRVSVFWDMLAPSPTSRVAPVPKSLLWHPMAYPQANWERYDQIVRLAAKYNLGLLFNVTGPGPAWAAKEGRGRRADQPIAADYAYFLAALGLRYSGSWRDPHLRGQYLPKVTHWSIWNEPNFARRSAIRPVRGPISPRVYRAMANDAWKILPVTGHAGDTVLLGETAPLGGEYYRDQGQMRRTVAPLRWIRSVYCLDDDYRPFRGREARRRGCPRTRRERRAFAARNPGLFKATGWAHHPYSLEFRPTYSFRNRDWVVLGGIRRLMRGLDRSFSRWGSARRLRVWLTEYGYQTDPPDPIRGLSEQRQASWMSWAEWLAYRNPRIATFAQFLLIDDGPATNFSPRDERYWLTWQSGLIAADGHPKPSLDEFQRPIHLITKKPRRGRRVRLFALYRPAPDGTPLAARIEFSTNGGEWQALRGLTVQNPRGYLVASVRPPRRGYLRVVWAGPRGEQVTRPVAVRFRR